MRKVLDNVRPESTVDTVLGTLGPTLTAAGTGMSDARLAAVMGHAFTFSMNKDGGEVWQLANIEWCLFFREMELLPLRFEHLDATLRGPRPAPTEDEVAAMKSRTWDLVRVAVDRGVPAVAWQAFTTEQRDSGVRGFAWSLLVGYDESDRTYVVRNQNQPEPWSVGFDRFGYTDPVNWYHVMVPMELRTVDPKLERSRTVAQALDYAHGRRFPPGGGCYPVDAVGLAAFELWRESLISGDAAPLPSSRYAWFLRWSRERAAAYFREWNEPEGDEIVAHYRAEVESATALQELCESARNGAGFDVSTRMEAARLLDLALESERHAIRRLETK